MVSLSLFLWRKQNMAKKKNSNQPANDLSNPQDEIPQNVDDSPHAVPPKTSTRSVSVIEKDEITAIDYALVAFMFVVAAACFYVYISDMASRYL